MRWLYSLDLGNGLDDIGIGSVYQRDTLTQVYEVSQPELKIYKEADDFRQYSVVNSTPVY